MDLEYFTPITERQNISVRKGTLSAKGDMEFAPKNTEIHLTAIELNGLDADYSHRLETAAKKQERVQKATTAAKEVSNAATSKIRIDVLKISQSTLGYLNRTTDPNVRIYADHIEASLKEFNNQFAKGSSEFQMSGRFMGSGPTRFTGTIRPESKNPDLSLNIAIENTEMKAMSKIFQAYGKFDIKRGEFSFFSEIAIRNNRIQGYVKPSRMGAALAFNTIFAIAPLFVIVLAIAGFVFGEEAARRELFSQVSGLVGSEGGEAIQALVRAAHKSKTGAWATVIAVATLFVGATGVFVQLQDALNPAFQSWKAFVRFVFGPEQCHLCIRCSRIPGYSAFVGLLFCANPVLRCEVHSDLLKLGMVRIWNPCRAPRR